MRFASFSFGWIEIDGIINEHEVVIDRGEVRKRKKGPSRQFRDAHGLPVMVDQPPWSAAACWAERESRAERRCGAEARRR